MEKARQIAVREIPYEETTSQQRAIMEEAGRILNFRIFDLFIMNLETVCQGDKIARLVLHERLLWFVQELRKEIRQQLDVSEIERNTPEDCEVDKVDEYFRKAPIVFTPESYDKFTSELTLSWIKDMKAQGK